MGPFLNVSVKYCCQAMRNKKLTHANHPVIFCLNLKQRNPAVIISSNIKTTVTETTTVNVGKLDAVFDDESMSVKQR